MDCIKNNTFLQTSCLTREFTEGQRTQQWSSQPALIQTIFSKTKSKLMLNKDNNKELMLLKNSSQEMLEPQRHQLVDKILTSKLINLLRSSLTKLHAMKLVSKPCSKLTDQQHLGAFQLKQVVIKKPQFRTMNFSYLIQMSNQYYLCLWVKLSNQHEWKFLKRKS